MYKIGLLGGGDGIGRSMLYVEFNKQAIVIDSGMEFPGDLSMLGVNKVVSSASYIKNNLSKVKGLFITHLHEDHVGGVRRFLEKFNVPVYAEPLTCEYLKRKFSLKDNVRVIPIKHDEKVQIGSMKVRPFEVEHSTIKAFGYEILSSYGNIVISGDFKMGSSAEKVLENVAKLGLTKNPLALLVESTNANKEGYCKSELDILDNIESVIREQQNKLFIISTFASNMTRVKNVIEIAQKYNQDIFVVGRNMEFSVQFMIDQGLIAKSKMKFAGNVSDSYAPDKGLVLSTGCQGEPQGGLYKLVERFKNKENKTVLFSSSVIPGNERSVNNIKIALYKKGFNIIEDSSLYHTSGHGRREEIKGLIKHLSPKFVIPIHGDYIQQTANKENSILSGVKEENVIFVENDSIIKIKKDKIEVSEIKETLEYITNNGVIKESLVNQKKNFAKNGAVIYSINGRFIKYTAIGIPENCKLNRVAKSFVQLFLQNLRGQNIDIAEFKKECFEHLLKEMRNEGNIPHIEIVSVDNKLNIVNKSKKIKTTEKTKYVKKTKNLEDKINK